MMAPTFISSPVLEWRLLQTKRKPMLLLACAINLLVATTSLAQVSERARKVLADREKVTSEGFWIYNDLAEGFRLAGESGKPMVVVLRCLPCEECVKLDDDVVDRDPVIRPLLEQFVCVRLVSTNGLDLSLFQFDTDQSFAVFFLRSDKTIYGRFGTRSHRTDWLGDVSLPGFAEALRGALSLHRSWPTEQASLAAKRGPAPTYARPELHPSLMDNYAYTSSIDYEGDVVKSCIHCHQIGDAIRDEYRASGKPIPEEVLYPYPHPKSIGIVFDPKFRATISEITSDSPASAAGLMMGDKILRMNGQPILSIADVQWVLHNTPTSGGSIDLQVARENKTLPISLTLEQGWRRKSDISWRASSWGLRRMATGGMKLESVVTEDQSAGATNHMALRVVSVGQYGPHAAAKNAGFKKNDVIIAVDSLTALHSEADFMRYCLTEKKPGEFAKIRLLRDKHEITLDLPMQP
jgi:serine protease Do